MRPPAKQARLIPSGGRYNVRSNKELPHDRIEGHENRQFFRRRAAQGGARPLECRARGLAVPDGGAGRLPDHELRRKVHRANATGGAHNAQAPACVARTRKMTEPVWLERELVLAI